MDFEELEQSVVKWGEDRLIFGQSNDLNQCTKLTEEITELYEAVRTEDKHGIIDGIGDSIVVLILIAAFNGLLVTDCLEYAYNQIKDRRGKMVNGLFVKE